MSTNTSIKYVLSYTTIGFKLQPAICPLPKDVIRFHKLPAETIQCILD